MTIIYTDGACKGNGKSGNNAGGFGVYVCYEDGSTRAIWGGDPSTTNNRMELLAAITALENTEGSVKIITDSQYVQKGITSWLAGWKSRGWKKSDKKAPENLDLWQRLDTLTQGRAIDWAWVKGHNGDAGNEMADKLANQGVTDQGNEFYPKNPEALTVPPDTMPLETNQSNPTQAKQQTSQTPSQPDASSQMDTAVQAQADMPAYNGDTSKANPYFVPILPDPINKDKAERKLIMDTETTGFEDQNGDRIVEVGIVELIGRKMTGEKLHVYLNPEKQMSDEVIKVHGISNAFVADKPKFSEVAQKLFDFMQGAQIIAHNAAFDMRFLTMEFDKVGLTGFADTVEVVDSLQLAKERYPAQKNSLDALVKRLNVGKKDRTFHGALLDAEILAEVYLAMTGGQVSLAIQTQEVQGDEDKDEDLSHLNALIAQTACALEADKAWRAAVLG